MKTKWVYWYDKKVPIGTRKRHFINYRLSEGWSFYKTINYANKMFGKKPNYTEPEKPEYDNEYDNCEHEYYLDGYVSRCEKCQETCQTCAHTLDFDICEECGAYDYLC